MSNPVGRVARITRFAVKAMAGQDLAAADVGMTGIAHDRGYAVLDKEGRYLSSAAQPRLLNARALVHRDTLAVELPDSRGLPQGEALDAAISDWLGEDLRLRAVEHTTAYRPEATPTLADHLGLSGADLPGRLEEASHLHFLTTAAIRTLRSLHPDEEVLFRSSFLVDGEWTGGVPENAWLGRRVRIGTATMILFGPPISCCASHDLGPARTADNTYGLHALVVSSGRVRRGDRVTIDDADALARSPIVR